MTTSATRQGLAAGAFLAAATAAPIALDDFHLSVLALIFLFAYLGIAWNIMMGLAGLLSLGHALYFGVGAYVVAILAERYGVSPWLGMIPAFVVPAGIGAVLGALGFRFGVRGVYFALLTIAFAELARVLFEHWDFVGKTGGFFLRAVSPDDNPLATFRGGALFFYYALLVTLALAWALTSFVLRSAVGYRWRAIREDEDAARALGVHAFRLKLGAVALSGGLTGVGGGWFALMSGSVFPDTVLGMRMSIELIIAPIVGGLGTVFGPILGAFIIVPLNEIARDLAQRFSINGMNLLMYGLVLIVVVAVAPRGCWPPIAAWLRLGGERPR